MNLTKLHCIGFILLNLSVIDVQATNKIEYFNLQEVTLLESPFEQAQELNKHYLLELEPDRLLAPFLRDAGLPTKAKSYPNWENSGLDGHIGGHYLSALSYMYASTNDKEIRTRFEYMISELKRCQDANGNGYIGGIPEGKAIWKEIAEGKINAGGFSLNNKWVPLYNIHKTYSGLRDAYLMTGNVQAKEMLIKMTDWAVRLVEKLSEKQIQDMLRSEHGGLNEVFADVASITGNETYLRLARQFSHRQLVETLIKHEDKLTGMHANTQIPKVLGFKRISEIDGNENWEDAARFFWESVVENRSVCIGGNSVSEHFNPTDDFSGMITNIEGPETCNTYNMLRLSKMLYQTSRNKKYIDYYERALYNHILSTQHPATGGLVYFTQMRPGHYRVYSQVHTSMWCCVGSGIENHSKYGEMIYAHKDNELFINLFIPSRLYWKAMKTEILQENNFPEEASTRFTINPRKKTRFTLQIRQPDWMDDDSLSIKINDHPYRINVVDGYFPIDRLWKKGDRVSVEMPMKVRVEQMPDHTNYYAFLYGPVVLAAKTGTEQMDGLFADESRGGHIAKGKKIPLNELPILVGEPEQLPSLLKRASRKPLTFKLNSVYPSHDKDELELIPFYRLHESRYILYWPQATPNEIKEIQKKTALEEQHKIALDDISLDKIICGEQQPESDHFIKQENSQAGYTQPNHWREARGLFSYRLNHQGINNVYLYVRYLDSDKNRHFDIQADGQTLTSLLLKGAKGDVLQTLVLPISIKQGENKDIEISFRAHTGSMTAKIVEVRLLKEKLSDMADLVEVSNGWAGNSINANVFRKNSLISDGETQFIAFYDSLGYLVLGKRQLSGKNWELKQSPFKGNIRDAHNSISIMLDGDGFLHVSWDHHGHPLNYSKGKAPYSIELGAPTKMTGLNENNVTYPEFFQLPSGDLIFMYRDGQSGKGNLVLNRYRKARKQWEQVQQNLIDGEGQRNAYWQACVDHQGVIHLSWVWRESWDVSSNHDMCYARSEDGGKTWKKSDGSMYTLPINRDKAEYVCRIPQSSELINQTSMTTDQNGYPYIATYWRSQESGIPQYHLVYQSESGWKVSDTKFRKTDFSLSGGGTKRIPISRPQVIVLDKETTKKSVLILFRDEERGSRTSLAVCNDLSKGTWEVSDLSLFPVGSWEPSYDTHLWQSRQQLHVFVQHVDQVDGEGLSSMPSQPVYVMEINNIINN